MLNNCFTLFATLSTHPKREREREREREGEREREREREKPHKGGDRWGPHPCGDPICTPVLLLHLFNVYSILIWGYFCNLQLIVFYIQSHRLHCL